MRLWVITLGCKCWVTTDMKQALLFTHAFGTIGFNLASVPHKGEEIDYILVNY